MAISGDIQYTVNGITFTYQYVLHSKKNKLYLTSLQTGTKYTISAKGNKSNCNSSCKSKCGSNCSSNYTSSIIYSIRTVIPSHDLSYEYVFFNYVAEGQYYVNSVTGCHQYQQYMSYLDGSNMYQLYTPEFVGSVNITDNLGYEKNLLFATVAVMKNPYLLDLLLIEKLC